MIEVVMRSTFTSKVLAKVLANRFAAEALAEFELTPADLANKLLTLKNGWLFMPRSGRSHFD